MRRSYHSDLKVQYAQRRISADLLGTVARSTRQRWKQKTMQDFWTPFPLHQQGDLPSLILQLKAENQYLKKKIKMLFCLVQVCRLLMKAFEIKGKQVHNVKQNMQQLMRLCDRPAFRKTVWRLLPFSAKQWNAWTARPVCPSSLQQLCRKTYPQQLTLNEQNIIRAACSEDTYLNWPLCSIYFQLMRQQKIACSISTFYKYCRLLNITRKPLKYAKHYTPIKAHQILKILHQDITVYRTSDGVKHYIYVIRDNYSRAILACKAATQYSSEVAKQTLKEVLTRFNLLNEAGMLITDDGSENKGTLEEWLLRPGRLWKKVVAQLDIIQSNSMVEAANKMIKYRFLHRQPPANTKELEQLLATAQQQCNSMPNAQLSGYTPDEVLAGALPDDRRFAPQKEEARKRRKELNSAFVCEQVCQT